MALHKFTPGGCRSNCETTNSCCPTGICTSPYTLYDLVLVRDGVPSASPIRLDTNIQTADCIWYSSSGVFTAQCGGVTMYGIANFSTSGGSTYLLVRVYDGPYPFTSANLLFWNVGSPLLLGASPADCGQTYSGGFTYTAAACSGYTWTFSLVPVAPECSTTGTTAGSGGSCCPCEDCRVFRDPFNRTPGGDMGSNWSEVAGDWSLTAYGTARIEAANALLLSTSAAPQVGVKLMTICRADASGDILRLILSYEDTDNYLFAEWKCASNGYVRVYERSGGTNTLIDDASASTVANAFTLFTVCVSESGLSITGVVSQGTSAPAFASGDLSATAVVGKYGLASGSTCSGESFGRVEMVKTSAGCEACATVCELCTATTPEFVVDLGASPWVTDPDSCCQLIYGEFTVAATPVAAIPSWVYSVSGASCDLWPVYDTCYWEYNDSSCDLWVLVRVGTATTGLHWAVEVHVLIGTQTTHRKWVYSKRLGLLSTPLDCSVGWTVNTLCGGGVVGVGECVGGTASPPSSVTVGPP